VELKYLVNVVDVVRVFEVVKVVAVLEVVAVIGIRIEVVKKLKSSRLSKS
jgi:hypothetical protein